MSGPRQPIELVVAKGAKHLTKAEIDSRRKKRLKPSGLDAADISSDAAADFFKIINQGAIRGALFYGGKHNWDT